MCSYNFKNCTPTTETPVSCQNLKIWYFNARSVLPKLDELTTLCSAEKPDILCLVETWLDSNIDNMNFYLVTIILFALIEIDMVVVWQYLFTIHLLMFLLKGNRLEL